MEVFSTKCIMFDEHILFCLLFKDCSIFFAPYYNSLNIVYRTLLLASVLHLTMNNQCLFSK